MLAFDKAIEVYWSDPEIGKLSAKDQILSTFGFVGPIVSVGAT